MNFILDINIILDNFNYERKEKFIDSTKTFEYCSLNNKNIFLASSSINNISFLKIEELKEEQKLTTNEAKKVVNSLIKDLLSKFKIAKTPSYLELDYENIENSLVISSAKAINAKVITRDKEMLEKYEDITISPKEFLEKKEPLKIDFANLNKQYFLYQDEIEKEMDKVLNSSSYIMGNAIKELEENLQNFTKAKYAISCSSGTDALLLAIMALDIKRDEEIITTPFSFIATAETIALLGVKPVFVDIDEKTYNIDATLIEEKITSKTKAIMPVSLYGQPANMDKIEEIAKKHNLKIIIDGAQSFGSSYNDILDSALGDISTTSFFPAKPLGCYGDGGAIFTNSKEIADKIKELRVHGQNKRYHHKYIGLGARMDTLQASILNVKLKHYPKDLEKRQAVAKKYNQALKDKDIILPFIDPKTKSAYAQYSIRVKNRDKLQEKLKDKNIPTAVHYPMPLHLQECFNYLNYKEGDFKIAEKISKEIMSLPLNPYLEDNEIEYIAKNIN